MGDRYYWTEKCPKCGEPMEVAYAESCEITSIKCHQCNTTFDVVMDFKLIEKKDDPFKPGWLGKQMKKNADEVKKWPRWMKKAANILD